MSAPCGLILVLLLLAIALVVLGELADRRRRRRFEQRRAEEWEQHLAKREEFPDWPPPDQGIELK